MNKYFVDIWNVPNVLTMLRLALFPVNWAAFLSPAGDGRPLTGLTLSPTANTSPSPR